MTTTDQVNVAEIINRAPLGAYQWRIILMLFVVAALDGFDTQAIAFVVPSIGAGWHIAPSAFGPVFAVGLLGSVAGSILMGGWGDRFGRKTVILGAMAEFALVTLACAHVRDLPQLMLCRFLAGLGLGGVLPNFLALASEYAPDRARTTMVTITMWGFPLGAAVGGMLTGGLIDQYGWPLVFHLGGALPLLCLPLLMLALPESIRFLAADPRNGARIVRILARIDRRVGIGPDARFVHAADGPAGTGVRALFQHGRAAGTLMLWLALFCSLLLSYCLLNWIPSLLRHAGLSTRDAVMGTVTLNVAGIVGSLAFSLLMNRSRHALLMAGAAYAAGAVATAMIGAVGSAWLVTAIACTGFFIIGGQIAVAAYVPGFYPTPVRGTGVGWSQGIARIGSLAGPLAGGMVLAAGATPATMFRLCAIPAAVSALALLALVMGQRRRQGRAEPLPPGQ